MKKALTIAVDGYSSCGKSTLAKDLSHRLGYLFIDTGAMYRGVTLFAMRNGFIHDGIIDKAALISQLDAIQLRFEQVNDDDRPHLFLNGEDVEDTIRTPEVAAHVSPVAAIREIRVKLVQQQQEMGKTGGVIMDGRDIGSVVFPDAELKLFVTAQPEIRAQRRLLELQEKGIAITLEEVMSNLMERDRIDTTRAEGPLIQTADAIVVDTSFMTRESQVEFALRLVSERIK